MTDLYFVMSAVNIYGFGNTLLLSLTISIDLGKLGTQKSWRLGRDASKTPKEKTLKIIILFISNEDAPELWERPHFLS